jgi:hypothetical protein
LVCAVLTPYICLFATINWERMLERCAQIHRHIDALLVLDPWHLDLGCMTVLLKCKEVRTIGIHSSDYCVGGGIASWGNFLSRLFLWCDLGIRFDCQVKEPLIL